MSRKSAKEKKLRRQKNKEEKILKDEINFDVFEILREEKLETKPEIGDFLKKYVKSIRVLVDYSKITIYPIMTYGISKVFVDFLDGHQIISDFKASPRTYFVYYGLEEVEMKERDLKMIVGFVQKLQEFSFIHT